MKNGKIMRHEICPISTVNTLGWASFLIKNNDENELYKFISSMEQDDTIMVDPVIKQEVILSVPRYLGDANFIVDDEFLKNKIHYLYLLADSQDNLVPLYAYA